MTKIHTEIFNVLNMNLVGKYEIKDLTADILHNLFLQHAIGFAQFVTHNDWVYLPSRDIWVNEENEENITPRTGLELFGLYLQTV